MPLEHGPVGSEAFKHNIEVERKAGKPEDQALAIAYSMAGEKHDANRLDAILTAVDSLADRIDALEKRRA